jgi:S-adenosylmethionine:tRNA ribosyltransferase-isomerase
LHFTPELLDRLRDRGVEIAEITLHVGYGTFQPVRVARVEDHRVEPESYSIGDASATAISRAIAEGRRVIAVGTTTTRALESAARREGEERGEGAEEKRTRGEEGQKGAGASTTSLFIFPGFEFQVVGGLVTNFHLPGSSLLMLVSAFAERELILRAYRHAIEQEYRFYSYGDAMLIL